MMVTTDWTSLCIITILGVGIWKSLHALIVRFRSTLRRRAVRGC